MDSVLLADIGGTNARFALQTSVEAPPEFIRVLPCAEYADIMLAIEAYFSDISAHLTERPRRGVIAIATPVTGDQISMTNHHWKFSTRGLSKSMGFDDLHVINDFTALALSLPKLAAHDLTQLGGVVDTSVRAPKALIGPGTGLGVSGLIPYGDNRWLPLSGEGGHTSFSPENAEEESLLIMLRKEFPQVSNEHLLSGLGLRRLYRMVCVQSGLSPQNWTPAEITANALSNLDPYCHRALHLFCRILGSVAGDLALTLGARGGVYLGGGIVPRILDFLKHSDFRIRFESKGRMRHYVQPIPIFAITAPYPALIGASTVYALEETR